MKVVRLDRRYQVYRKFQHRVGLRFPTWDAETSAVEQVVHDLLGSQYQWLDPSERVWRGCFGRGQTPGTNRRPYWITFRNPADLTMVLLKLNRA